MDSVNPESGEGSAVGVAYQASLRWSYLWLGVSLAVGCLIMGVAVVWVSLQYRAHGTSWGIAGFAFLSTVVVGGATAFGAKSELRSAVIDANGIHGVNLYGRDRSFSWDDAIGAVVVQNLIGGGPSLLHATARKRLGVAPRCSFSWRASHGVPSAVARIIEECDRRDLPVRNRELLAPDKPKPSAVHNAET